jgi:DNA-binding transcriptional MerR regulator
MLMSELSSRSGVPIATIKYYLREGLLPPGAATSATRADYGETHVRRLRLIRALLDIGEVPVAAIGKILAVVDDDSASVHQMLGTVQYELGPHPTGPAEDDPDWQAASREVNDLIAGMGWTVAPNAPARRLLAQTLAALRSTGSAPPGPGLRTYAEAMAGLAASEVASLDPSARDLSASVPSVGAPPAGDPPAGDLSAGDSRVALAESAIVGMVLHERVIMALRRLAQEDASARYFGIAKDSAPAD